MRVTFLAATSPPRRSTVNASAGPPSSERLMASCTAATKIVCHDSSHSETGDLMQLRQGDKDRMHGPDGVLEASGRVKVVDEQVKGQGYEGEPADATCTIVPMPCDKITRVLFVGDARSFDSR